MKGPQLASLIWIANIGVLAGAGFLGYKTWNDYRTERNDNVATVKSMKTNKKKVDWDATVLDQRGGVSANDFLLDKLSPRARPKKKVVQPDIKDPDPPKEKEWSDDELKVELQNWLKQKFVPLYMLYGMGPEHDSAKVTAKDAKNTEIILFADLQFSKHFNPRANPTAPSATQALAQFDIRVVKIEKDAVLFNLPVSVLNNPKIAKKYHSKRFDVKLPWKPDLNYRKDTATTTRTTDPKETTKPDVVANAHPDDPTPTNPAPWKSGYDEKTDTWTIGREDYQGIKVDEWAKYSTTVYDKTGKPLGIQISDDIPEGHTVLKRGAQRGDIIKSINGVAVTGMSSVRSVVGKMRKEGVTHYEVVYIRNGVEGRKTFNVPKKKDGDK